MDNESKFMYAHEVTEAPVINSGGRNRYYFAVYHGLSQVKIFSYDDSDIFDPILIHTFPPKEVTFAHWSPLGSFLVGAKWNGVVIMHTEPYFKETDIAVDGEVHKVDVSPSENFLIVTHVRRENENHFKLEIRDMKTTEIRKTLNLAPKNGILTQSASPLSWAYNDDYFAVLCRTGVSVYETTTFSSKRNMQFKKMDNFCWSPSASMLVVYGSSTIKFFEIPERKLMAKFNVAGVDKVNLTWHRSGSYIAGLCIWGDDSRGVILISLKSWKAVYVSSHRDYIDFAWEQSGNRFAACRGSTNAGGSTVVEFYAVDETEEFLSVRLHTLESTSAHFLRWSPIGPHIAMRGLSNNAPSNLYFYNVDDRKLVTVRFPTDLLAWDSSGRFVFARAPRLELFNPVLRIWSAAGEKLVDVGWNNVKMAWRNIVSPIAGSSKACDMMEVSIAAERDDESVLGYV